jgi:hypothetical protein
MTARNAVIKANASLFATPDVDAVPMAIAPANISPTTSFSIEQDAINANSDIDVNVTCNFGTNFTPADFTINVVIYDVKNAIAYFNSAVAAEGVKALNVPTPSINNQTAYVMFAFLTSTDANGKKFISQTAFKQEI